ncbi:MAG: hypothetical protein ACYDBB_07945 [Armatimonadota bacterium]
MMHNLPAFLCALGAGLAFAVLGLIYRLSSQRGCRAMPFIVVFTATAGCLALGRAYFEPAAWSDPRMWALGITVGISFVLAIAFFMQANTMGPASVNWTFGNLGLLFPILLAPSLFGEPLLGVDIIMLACFLLMLIAIARGMMSSNETPPQHLGRYSLLLLGILGTNGLNLMVFKLKAAWFPSGSSAGMTAIFYFSAMIIALVVASIRSRGQLFSRAEVQVGMLAGVASGTGILLTMASLTLPSVVAFPVNQGVALLGGVLLTAMFYHEHFTSAKLIGLALGVVVLLLGGMREQITALLHVVQ